MLPLLLLAAAVAAPAISRRLTGDAFGPVSLIVTSWAGSIALTRLEWIPYVSIGADTWRFVALNLGALAAGVGLGAAIARLVAARRIDDAAGHDGVRAAAARWVLPLALVGLAGVAWYVVAAVRLLGWHAFADGERLRQALTTYEIPSTFLAAQFFCLIAPLTGWALMLAGTRLSPLARAAAAAAALGTVVTTDRSQAFALVSTVFLMWVFARGATLGWRRLVLVGAIVPLILAANFVAVDAWRRNVLEVFELKLAIEGPASRATPLGRAFWRRTTSAYFYATSSYPALELLLAAPGPRTGGALSFYPIARALERAGLTGPTPRYIPGFVTVTRAGQDPPAYSNAYTYLTYPLRDFGRAGAVAYSLALGVASGLVFAWARRARRSPARLLLVGQVSTAIAFLPLFDKFNNTAWWYVLVWTLVPFAIETWRQRRVARGGGGR
jgi:hypothetical protein